MQLWRLNRLLAVRAEISRRRADQLIQLGQVSVAGRVVTNPAVQVDPTSVLHLSGKLVKPLPRTFHYYKFYKPAGMVTSMKFQPGSLNLSTVIKRIGVGRLLPIGRLDRESEGLLLLTNDSQLIYQLTHPKFGIQKVYRVKVFGQVDQAKLNKLKQGIRLREGRVRVDDIRLVKTLRKASWLEITLHQGWNREIRRLASAVNWQVVRLIRTKMAGIKLGQLPVGSYEPLSAKELKQLRQRVRERVRQLNSA